jgi:hypothetical protein
MKMKIENCIRLLNTAASQPPVAVPPSGAALLGMAIYADRMGQS